MYSPPNSRSKKHAQNKNKITDQFLRVKLVLKIGHADQNQIVQTRSQLDFERRKI